MKKGKYIVIEGIDGTGKSTQAQMLVDTLKSRQPTLKYVEPSRGHVGQLIRKALNKEICLDPKVLGMLFPADTYEQFTKAGGIINMVNHGHTVVADRSYFSSLAYQGQHLPVEWIMNAHRLSIDLLKPDLLIYLIAPIDTCIERIEKRGEPLRLHEQRDFLTKVNTSYQETMFRLYCQKTFINADKNRYAVANEIWREVEKIL